MADPIKVTNSPPVASNPEAKTPTGPTGTAAPGYTSSTTIASVKDLQEKVPELYNGMLKSIAMNIIKEMQKQQDALSRMTKK